MLCTTRKGGQKVCCVNLRYTHIFNSVCSSAPHLDTGSGKADDQWNENARDS